MQDYATRFVVASLATWRVAHLIAEEDGPADVVVRVRATLGDGVLGRLMDCFACTSVWAAAPLTLAVTRRPREVVPTWLALSGAACLAQRLGHDDLGGTDDGMLWQQSGSVEGGHEGSHPAASVANGGGG
jgi:hypothetical protein